jgi:hypothetical protein
MSISSTGLSKHERTHRAASQAEPMTCTVRDASRLSGLGVSTIWKLIAENKLDSVLVLNRRLVTLPSLRRLLTPQAAEAAAPDARGSPNPSPVAAP